MCNVLFLVLMKTPNRSIIKCCVGHFYPHFKMPSPVDEESTALNKTMRKGVENKGQETSVCKCENCAPTDIKSIVDTNGNEEIENVKNSSKVKGERYSTKEEQYTKDEHSEKKAFIMEETSNNQDFIVTFSCSQCACIALSNYSEDKHLRKRRKKSKRCLCVTVLTVVIFCLSVIASLSYLTFNLLSDKTLDNQIVDFNDQMVTKSPQHHISKTVTKVVSGLAKFELDVDRYNRSIEKVLPWAEQKGSISDNFYRYERSNKSISVLQPGVYFIQVTLNTDTNYVRHGKYETILSCITYQLQEKCQRMTIPAGMSIPIHLQDVVKLDAFDTVTIKVHVHSKQVNCLYTTPHRNTLTIVHLH